MLQDKTRIYDTLEEFQHDVVDYMNKIERSERDANDSSFGHRQAQNLQSPIFRYSWRSKGAVGRINKFINLSCTH